MCTLDGPSVLIAGGLALSSSRPRFHNVPRRCQFQVATVEKILSTAICWLAIATRSVRQEGSTGKSAGGAGCESTEVVVYFAAASDVCVRRCWP
jgi:hypothetical protein